MKRFLVNGWSAMLLLIFVVSCGKEKSTEEDAAQYFIKCKIGSVDKTFNFGATAVKQDVGGGITNYLVYGKAVADPNNLENFGFSIRLWQIPFNTGTYKANEPTTDYTLTGNYMPNTTDPSKIFSSNDLEETNPFQVTYTEITATTLSGTFMGKLRINDPTNPNADSAVITNGQFKVKLQ
jgi:hypothetical protein